MAIETVQSPSAAAVEAMWRRGESAAAVAAAQAALEVLRGGERTAMLLALADRRLYAAKYGGRNRVIAAD